MPAEETTDEARAKSEGMPAPDGETGALVMSATAIIHRVTWVDVEAALDRVERGLSGVDDANLLRSIVIITKGLLTGDAPPLVGEDDAPLYIEEERAL